MTKKLDTLIREVATADNPYPAERRRLEADEQRYKEYRASLVVTVVHATMVIGTSQFLTVRTRAGDVRTMWIKVTEPPYQGYTKGDRVYVEEWGSVGTGGPKGRGAYGRVTLVKE